MTRAQAIPDTITVHVPFSHVKRGGRKEMVLPPQTTVRAKIDGTLVKALARAFRWKRMLDSGSFTSVTEIAAHEKLPFTYISRVLRLVTSRKLVWSFLEQLGLQFVPVLHRLQG